MAITPLPDAPEPTDSTAQFNTKAFAWVAALDTFTTEANATAAAVTASQTAAAGSALGAANSATSAAAQVVLAQAQVALAEDAADAAATSAETAAAATNAVLWVSGTTYAIGDLVWSPADGRIYRRIIAGAGTTDPSADATNWSQLTRVVEQSDIGTDPNQVPLNQYLGSMAYVEYPDFTRPFLVASLPAAGIIGRFAHVTDGDAALAWGATVVNSGSGATPYLVWDNGTNWTVVGK